MDYNNVRMLEGSADSRVRRFWELFERQEFFESHEVLEGPWREAGSDF